MCRIWSEMPKTGFLKTQLIYIYIYIYKYISTLTNLNISVCHTKTYLPGLRPGPTQTGQMATGFNIFVLIGSRGILLSM